MAKAKTNLTESGIAALPIAKPGKHYEVMDTQAPGLGIRISSKPKVQWKTKAEGGKPMPCGQYIYVGVLPGKSFSSRYTLGTIGEMELEQARDKARLWRKAIKEGKSPAVEQRKARQAQKRQQKNTFGAVFEAFATQKLASQRQGADVAQDIRREFLPMLAEWAITDISDEEILEIINAKKAKHPSAARNLLGGVRRMFKWAKAQGEYGLKRNPIADLDTGELFGDKVEGDRVLDDTEIKAFWRAATKLGRPWDAPYKMLLMTGLRKNEVARAKKEDDYGGSEFDFKARLWTIPKERMKAKNNKARPHVVPLTQDILEVLAEVPDYLSGPYVFSTTFGKSPVYMGSKVKATLDGYMLEALKELAQERGEDPKRIKLKPWKNHDLRRTARTNFSGLRDARGAKISDHVCEVVIAHVRPGVKGTYDKYDYLNEKQECLELWAARLKQIVGIEPPPSASGDNVADLAEHRASRKRA